MNRIAGPSSVERETESSFLTYRYPVAQFRCIKIQP